MNSLIINTTFIHCKNSAPVIGHVIPVYLSLTGKTVQLTFDS